MAGGERDRRSNTGLNGGEITTEHRTAQGALRKSATPAVARVERDAGGGNIVIEHPETEAMIGRLSLTRSEADAIDDNLDDIGAGGIAANPAARELTLKTTSERQ